MSGNGISGADWRKDDMAEEQDLMRNLLHLLGNQDAVKFCLDLAMVIHAHDDLIDKDKERTNEDFNRAFTAMMFDMPNNPFYMAYGHQLRPIILSMIMKWKVANEFESGTNGHHKRMAWMLRADVFNVFHYCAYLIGGHEFAEEVGPSIWALYGESLSDFLEEFK